MTVCTSKSLNFSRKPTLSTISVVMIYVYRDGVSQLFIVLIISEGRAILFLMTYNLSDTVVVLGQWPVKY